MNYQIVNSHSTSDLTQRVNELIKEGWEPVGSHQVSETYHQNKFRGMDHVSTTIEREYTQTMIKK